MTSTQTDIAAGFVGRVRTYIRGQLGRASASLRPEDGLRGFRPGKLLRSRLAGRLLATGSMPARESVVESLCAATEMIHSASLLHDDVIDGGVLRRGLPTLWTQTGSSPAVLIGDLFLFDAMSLVASTDKGWYLKGFICKIRQVVEAEIRQELLLRGAILDEQTCLDLAREKTGPLFAFTAQVCGGQDAALSAALEEAGYLLGTAYQLADDLLDGSGDETAAGKTLGTDRRRSKFTLPQTGQAGVSRTRQHVASLCARAVTHLDGHPRAREGLLDYVIRDLQPVLLRLDPALEVDVGSAL